MNKPKFAQPRFLVPAMTCIAIILISISAQRSHTSPDNETEVTATVDAAESVSDAIATKLAVEKEQAEIAANAKAAELSAKKKQAEIAAKAKAAELAAKKKRAEIAAKAKATELAAKKEQAEIAAKAKATELAAKKQQAEIVAKAKAAELAAKKEQAEIAAKAKATELAAKKEQAEIVAKAKAAELAAKKEQAEIAAKAKASIAATVVPASTLAKDLMAPQYVVQNGMVDKKTFNGYRRFHGTCHACHGQDASGGSFAPSLVESLKTVDYELFRKTVVEGRVVTSASGAVSAMPAFSNDPNVMKHLDDIYVYLAARSDGVLAAGRPKKIPKK